MRTAPTRRPGDARRCPTPRRGEVVAEGEEPARSWTPRRALGAGPTAEPGAGEDASARAIRRPRSPSLRSLSYCAVGTSSRRFGARPPASYHRVTCQGAAHVTLLGSARRVARLRPASPAVGDDPRVRRLARLRQHAGPEPPLAADADHEEQRRPARAPVHGRLPPDRPELGAAQQSYPSCRRHDVHDDERRPRLRPQRDDGRRHLALEPPNNVAVFSNFGIVANRGVALCDGQAVPAHARHDDRRARPERPGMLARVPISRPCRARRPDYGYSETSAPICGNHRLVIGAAGSEYGVRGFVMAYTHRPLAGLGESVLDDPAGGHGWRRASRIVGGGVVWTPSTIDTTTNTLYFGTGSATPLYFPSLRPGSNPRADSLIAVDLAHREAEVVAAADGAQRVVVRHRAAAARLHRQGRRQEPRDRLGRDDGGRLVRVRREDRPPIYQRVKVIDRTEHPPLQPGKPVVVYPSLARRPQLLAGVVRPEDELHLQRRGRDGGGGDPGEADADAEEAQAAARRRLPRARRTATSARTCPGWHDHGSISAIDVNTGRRVWKFKTPEPERGGVTTTASGLGFAGGGDGVLARVRPEDRQGPLDVPDRPSDRGRPVDLLGRRQAVRRDHVRRHADVVGRRHGERAAGVRARRHRRRNRRRHSSPRGTPGRRPPSGRSWRRPARRVASRR